MHFTFRHRWFELRYLGGLRRLAVEGEHVAFGRNDDPIAVNNLAGVPSIVFGVFGLGFFVYTIGGSIDRAFYADALPTPTYGPVSALEGAYRTVGLSVRALRAPR